MGDRQDESVEGSKRGKARDGRAEGLGARQASWALFLIPVVVLVLVLGYGLKAFSSAGGLADARLKPAATPLDNGFSLPRPAQVGNARADEFFRAAAQAEPAPSFVPPKTGLITIDDELFTLAYDEIYEKRASYYGREIRLGGFVLYQEGLKPGEFLLGRKLVTCCEEHAYFIGFVAEADGPPPPEYSRWEATGVIEERPYVDPDRGMSFTVPAIRIRALRAAPGLTEAVSPPRAP
jgi:hypothetical protein